MPLTRCLLCDTSMPEGDSPYCCPTHETWAKQGRDVARYPHAEVIPIPQERLACGVVAIPAPPGTGEAMGKTGGHPHAELERAVMNGEISLREALNTVWAVEHQHTAPVFVPTFTCPDWKPSVRPTFTIGPATHSQQARGQAPDCAPPSAEELEPPRSMPVRCKQCGGVAEKARRCYATPVCFACLPPPKPLRKAGGKTEGDS